MSIFYRAVRNLVDFSLVTNLTKYVSKVRETVRKCEKILQNDCETLFMTSDSQKMTSRFLDSYFCTKFQISQPGWYRDRAIKILQVTTSIRLNQASGGSLCFGHQTNPLNYLALSRLKVFNDCFTNFLNINYFVTVSNTNIWERNFLVRS